MTAQTIFGQTVTLADAIVTFLNARDVAGLFCTRLTAERRFARKKDLPDYFKVKPIIEDPKQAALDLISEVPTQYVNNPKNLDEYVLDTHGHLIIRHDLFNHDGMTKDGIAEAFAEFAKKESLSFF